MSTWRVNFGNGQVQDVASRAEATRVIEAQTQYKSLAHIQRYAGEGEWVKVK